MVMVMDILSILGLGDHSWAWEWYILDHMALGPTQWARGQIPSINSLTGRFMLEKRTFWARNQDFLGNAISWMALGPTQWVRCKNPSMNSLTGRFMLEKPAFWAQNHDFHWKFLDFLRISRISLDMLGNSKMDPPKSGCEVDFGRRGKLTCHRIDELFKPNCPPGPSQDPRRTPQNPPGRFWKIL